MFREVKKVNFIIVEESFLIREGLKKILSYFPEVDKITELENVMQIKRIQDTKSSIYIINSLFTDGSFLKNKKIDNERVIEIENSSTISSNNEFIKIYEKKEEIIEKISKLLQKIPGKNNENNNELSVREKDVLKQIVLGKTNKEIGETLFISPHTVITHRKNIVRKLDIKTVPGLTVYAILNRIISIENTNPKKI